jgi:hypothetical protein
LRDRDDRDRSVALRSRAFWWRSFPAIAASGGPDDRSRNRDQNGAQIVRLYNQMPDPKYVISMGACAIPAGRSQGYNVLKGIDRYIPVDVYIPMPAATGGALHAFMGAAENRRAETDWRRQGGLP